MPILARDAALAAKKYFDELVGPLPGLTLEEVKRTDEAWVVTFSYFQNLASTRKSYKVLTVEPETGEVLSMINAEPTSV